MLVYDRLVELGEKYVSVEEVHGDYVLSGLADELALEFYGADDKVVSENMCRGYLVIYSK